MHEFDAGHHVEQFAREVARRAVAGGGIQQGCARLFAQRDQRLHTARGHRRVHYKNMPDRRIQHHRREITQHVIAEFRVNAGVHRNRERRQKQRVAIARSLINDPLIIMGDEPTGNLDKKNSEIVFDIFRRLADEFNQTLLIVTHDQEFAQRTHRLIEMEDGRIIGNREL